MWGRYPGASQSGRLISPRPIATALYVPMTACKCKCLSLYRYDLVSWHQAFPLEPGSILSLPPTPSLSFCSSANNDALENPAPYSGILFIRSKNRRCPGRPTCPERLSRHELPRHPRPPPPFQRPPRPRPPPRLVRPAVFLSPLSAWAVSQEHGPTRLQFPCPDRKHVHKDGDRDTRGGHADE